MKDRMRVFVGILMLALMCLLLGFGIDAAREEGISLSAIERANDR